MAIFTVLSYHFVSMGGLFIFSVSLKHISQRFKGLVVQVFHIFDIFIPGYLFTFLKTIVMEEFLGFFYRMLVIGI